MDLILKKVQQNLEDIKKVAPDGFEYWSARDLKDVLGYKEWRKFSEVIEKAKLSCKISDKNPLEHFVGADKLSLTANGGRRNIEDILLTRLACYLITLNGDPRKTEIALSQLYFANQTRKQELLEQREYENKRLESRKKLKNTESKIESTLYERGMKLPVEFATFKNRHIESLYGGMTTQDLKRRKNIPQGRALADFDTDVELKAKDFALAMTDHNIKEKNLRNKYDMTEEVVKNSKATRQTLLSRGIRPENLKAEEDLKMIESRRKKELKSLNKKLK
jgi:DNA-damage-inducible protein D